MGWIRIYRELLDSAIWNTNEPFTKGQAWIDLLMLANFEDAEQIVGYETIKVRRGSYMTTIRDLSDRWKWSKSKTANYLHFLEKLKMISVNADTKRTLITVVKYDDFQGGMDTKRTRSGRKADTTRTQKGNLLYKEKREEEKEVKKSEVMYFENLNVDNAFRDYLQMRKEIKAPMTDRAITLAVNKLKELSGGDPQLMIDIINQSVMNGWKGLYELKTNKQQAQPFNPATYAVSKLFEEGGLYDTERHD